MRIIDAHHHIWDLERLHYPWLSNPIEHIAGDYASIRRSYRIADFLRDARGQDLARSVHVQAELDHGDDPVKETAWLQAVADDPGSGGSPHGIVAYADLSKEDVEDVLQRHLEHPNLRGIRQILNHGPDPKHHFVDRGDLMEDTRWRAGLALLEQYGLSFDLQVWPWQMQDAAALAAMFPGIQLILNHAGMPLDRESEGLEVWRCGMQALAAARNVAVKISGLGMFDRHWTVISIRPLVLETIETFGTDRCMFASNFPLDRLMTSYDAIWCAFDEITTGFSDDERRAMFHDNAARYYRL